MSVNTVIAFILIFGTLVFFHELGHLILAQRAGILCREFAIGFGPKIFSFKKNETVYTIRLLPIGGFVRMAGEDPEMVEVKPGYTVGLLFNKENKVEKIIINQKEKYPDALVIEVEEADLEHQMRISGYEQGNEDQLVSFSVSETSFFIVDGEEVQVAPYNRQFHSKTVWQRIKAIAAGPIMNFILAYVILVMLGLMQGVPSDEPVLGKLIDNGRAAEAGLKEGDRIQTINGEKMSSWTDIVNTVREHPEKELKIVLTRDNVKMTKYVTPESVKSGKETVGRFGAYNPVQKGILTSISYGATETVAVAQNIVTSLSKIVTGQFSIDMLAGPVGIYDMTEQVAKTGIINLLKLAAFLSINLGIVNLLPIPALDGGRLLFLLIEAVRGKPINREKEAFVVFIGVAFLMLLMLVVTWNDIQRLFL
ncbi:RIP metalloprotease RseP [Bacillus glycinifermentans]|uniref:Zinc metalloprotease n=1 Tax=Bacillus glycinifermentans TaxID=1664069 RepID=A0ABU6H3N4_9BACI|nr:RIP metalloprotease RseP [Bacillus glycinifermentans]ATH91452.1 RIP metalloprotease RseP [Bacillus glycinifermentans]MEC0485230.1 RIP metalloprotease RseP [Bacillus glycinifermentans]MEC0495584.1 RIP metalloprotease RseP [Bacillus glycinifermentans]MEC0540183.1 RIP metalloprotease RseP [Bacillus glycinifermentans]UOY89054.1 RIP metalloprotease RseP [Bacillus glycinifermentans]